MCHVPVCTAHPPYAVVTKVRLKMNVVKAKFFNFHTKKTQHDSRHFRTVDRITFFGVPAVRWGPQTPKRTPQTGHERKSTVVSALARRL